MPRLAVVLLAVSCAPNTTASLALALDPYTDHAPPFAGTWVGTMTFTAAPYGEPPVTSAVPLAVVVRRTGVNEVHMAGLCGDGSGAQTAPVVAYSHQVQLADVSCPPQALPLRACPSASVKLHFENVAASTARLSLSGEAITTDCGSVSFSFLGSSGRPGAPLLSLSVEEAAPYRVGAAVHLHVSLISGAASSYAWTLAAPAGSAATVVAAGEDAVLVPDLAGVFGVSVSGTSAAGAGPATSASLVVTSSGPQLVTLVPAAAVIGAATALNASGTQATSFSWTLRSRPASSAAQLSDAQSGIAHFTPDVAGDYLFYLAAGAASGVSSADFTVTAYPPVPTLPFTPTDVKYSRPLGRLVAVAGSTLHLYDPAGAVDESLALTGGADVFGLGSEGTFAVVHGNQEIWCVDLSAQTVLAHWPISTPPRLNARVVVSDPQPDGAGGTARFAYLMPSIVEVRNLSTGAAPYGNRVAAGDGLVEPGSAAFLSFTPPDGTIARYALVNGGLGFNPPSFPVKSYGHGWLSSDGASLLLASRTIVRTSDYTATGAVTGYLVSAAAEANGRWFYVDNTSAVYVQDAAGTRKMDLPKLVVGGVAHDLAPRSVFFDADASHRIVLASINSPETWAILVAPND